MLWYTDVLIAEVICRIENITLSAKYGFLNIIVDNEQKRQDMKCICEKCEGNDS